MDPQSSGQVLSALPERTDQPPQRPRLVTVRSATVTDAVGIGMLHHATISKLFSDHGAQFHADQESLVEVWHDKIVDGAARNIAVATIARGIVGVILVEDTGADDRGLGKPARDREIVYFTMLEDFFDTDIMQRLLDYVLPEPAPAQIWIARDDKRMRAFLRSNGFTLDGLSVRDDNNIEYSRIVR